MANENMNAIENEVMNLTEDAVVDTEVNYELPGEPTTPNGGIKETVTKIIVTVVGYKLIEKGVKVLWKKGKNAWTARKEAKAAKAETEVEPEIEVIVEDAE